MFVDATVATVANALLIVRTAPGMLEAPTSERTER